jgi:hypothetical protein
LAENGRRRGDDALALALASGKSVRDAAEAAGIGERTATRRVADPGFRRRVAELRSEMVDRALGRMADGMTEAAETLRALLKAEGESVRLGAARSVLELGSRLRESVEFEDRFAALEERISWIRAQNSQRGGDGLTFAGG